VDTITLGAFPRSGNHYFQHLVETAFADVRCNWLYHRMSDWDNKPNRVTIVRNPLDCVSSWISTTEDSRSDRAEKVLDWYMAYYEKIKSLNGIVVLDFDQLVQDGVGSISKVCDHYDLPQPLFSDNESLYAAFDKSVDYVWANWIETDLDQVKLEVSECAALGKAISLFEELCTPNG
jgi:hypothetical protein